MDIDDIANSSAAADDYSVPDYTSELNAHIYELNRSGECSDVALAAGVDQKRFPVNRAILSAASPYFKALFNGAMQEAAQDVITIEGVTGDTLQALIRFCYIGRIHITAENADDLLAAASRMELIKVEKLCEQHYQKMLSHQNCLGIWLLADQYSFDELKIEAHAVAIESLYHLVNGEEYRNLSKDDLQRLLADDHLFVYSEEDVLEALVGWIRHDEDERKVHFAELINLVRLEGMKSEFFTGVLMKHCSDWASLELFQNLVKSSANNPAEPREGRRRPTPMIVGTDAHKVEDRFTIEKFSGPRKDLHEVVSFVGYRSGHSAVQADQYLYILGGRDVDGNTLDKVQRVNIRNWTVDDVKPMAQKRVHFVSAYLNGCIYAIGGNFDPSASQDINRSVERYNIEEDEWSEVAQMHGFNQHPRQIQAIAFSGLIFVVYPGGMYSYDPLFNKWWKKASPPRFGTKFDIFIDNGRLVADLYEPGEIIFEEYIYDAPANQWKKHDDYAFPGSFDYLFNLEHSDVLCDFQVEFTEDDSISTLCGHHPADFVSKRRFTAAEKACFGNNFKLVAPALT